MKTALTDRTVVRAELPINFFEIVPGIYLGTTATKQSDGSFLASEVHVFCEDQRGVGEGISGGAQRGAAMINASLERVEDVAVLYQRQVDNSQVQRREVKVLVPLDVSVVKRIVTDRSALRTGTDVSYKEHVAAAAR